MAKDDNILRELSPVHYDIWNELESMYIDNTHDKQEFILPRGLGKSTVINIGLSCWLHVFHKSTYTLVLANLESDAINFIENIRKALGSVYVTNSFGQLVGGKNRTSNRLELELDNDTKLKAYSSQTSVRGTSYISPKGIYRPTTIISDDYQSLADILTEDAKRKKYDRWVKDVVESGDSAVYRNGKLIKQGSKFIVIGTPLAQGCYIDQISNNPEYKLFHRSVVNFDVDEYFSDHEHWQKFKSLLFNNKLDDPLQVAKKYYSDNQSSMKFDTIWDKYQCDDIAVSYFNKRLAFMQELMCNVENIGDKWFTSNRTMPQVEMEQESFTKTMLTIDTAGVTNVDKSRSDSFAFVVGSSSDNGFKYVRTAQLRKFNEFDEYINHVIKLLKLHTDISAVFIEKNQYGGLDLDRIKTELYNHPQLLNRDITFINEMQRKNKGEKISTIASDVNNGRIIFCVDRVERDFLQQVMDFSGQMFSKFDDAPDCLAEFATRIDDISQEVQSITFLPHFF